jgi:hypothetical protein
VLPDLHDIQTVKPAESEVAIAALIDIIENFPVKPPSIYIALERTKACHRGISLMTVAIITTSVGAIPRAIYAIDTLFASAPFPPLERAVRY